MKKYKNQNFLSLPYLNDGSFIYENLILINFKYFSKEQHYQDYYLIVDYITTKDILLIKKDIYR